MTTSTEHARLRALRRIAYNAHVSVDQAIDAAGYASVIDTLKVKGFVEPDPEWSGCLIATEAGLEWLNYWDGTSEY